MLVLFVTIRTSDTCISVWYKPDIYMYHLKINVFSRPLLDQNYMYGSISIKNISFSKNCDIKTTKLGKVYS